MQPKCTRTADFDFRCVGARTGSYQTAVFQLSVQVLHWPMHLAHGQAPIIQKEGLQRNNGKAYLQREPV